MDWVQLARDVGKQTTVLYMGFKSVDSICKRLREDGAPGETPMAMIESATSSSERALHGALASMPAIARKHEEEISGPVLFLLGPTAAFPAHLEKLSAGRPWKRARTGSCDAC